MTDFRALCAELLQAVEDDVIDVNDGQRFQAVVDRARAALAQPEPQGPTDEELMQLLFDDYRGVIEFVCDVEEEAHVMANSHVKFARVVLARWGRTAIEPVSVTERLPGPEDCDAEGRCWVVLQPGVWVLMKAMPPASHWLPHHTLPVPQQEAEHG